MSNARASLVPIALALGGCVLVDNPNYLELGDEQAGTSTSASDESGESLGSTSETSDSSPSDSTSDTSDGCPLGSLGCPCDGDMCASELACMDGICVVPTQCPSEDLGIVVALAPNNDPDGDNSIGLCQLSLALEGTTLLGNANCSLGVADFTFSIAPFYLAEQPVDLIGTTPATALMRIDPNLDVFVHLVLESGPELWLVEATTLDAGDPDLTGYPVPLVPSTSDCPALPELCGVSQRRAIMAGDVLVYDGSLAVLGDTVRMWVDEARSVCGVDAYRFALISY